MTELAARVERLERREAEMTELFGLFYKRIDALCHQVDLIGEMLVRHLGLPPHGES